MADAVPAGTRVSSRVPLWPDLIPVIAVAVAVAIGFFLYGAVVNCGLWGMPCSPHEAAFHVSNSIERTQLPFGELRARMAWAVSVLVCALALMLTIVAALRSVLRSFRGGVIVVAACVIPAAVLWRLLPTGNEFAPLYPLITRLYNGFFADETVFMLDLLGAASLALLTIAVVGIGRASRSIALPFMDADAVAEPATAGTAATAARELSRLQSTVTYLLLCAALALGAAALEASALYNWALHFVEPIRLAENPVRLYYDGSDIPETISAAVGAFYSVLLACLFGPLLLQLRHRANYIARVAVGPEAPGSELETWLGKHSFQTSVRQQITSVVALITPLLAGGPLAALFESIS